MANTVRVSLISDNEVIITVRRMDKEKETDVEHIYSGIGRFFKSNESNLVLDFKVLKYFKDCNLQKFEKSDTKGDHVIFVFLDHDSSSRFVFGFLLESDFEGDIYEDDAKLDMSDIDDYISEDYQQKKSAKGDWFGGVESF